MHISPVSYNSVPFSVTCFFFNDTATTEIYTLSLHDALPISDTDPSNNSSTDTDTSSPTADLAITKTDGSATYTPGGDVTNTRLISNNTLTTYTVLSVTDTIPVLTGVTWTSSTAGTANLTSGR